MKAKLRNGALACALLGGAALFAVPAFADDFDDGPDVYVAPAYAPDLYPPEIYPVPFAPVPPPRPAEIYAPPPEAYIPPPVEEYEPAPAIIVGD